MTRCMAWVHMDWWERQFAGLLDFACGLPEGHDGDHARDEAWEQAEPELVEASAERYAALGLPEMD